MVVPPYLMPVYPMIAGLSVATARNGIPIPPQEQSASDLLFERLDVVADRWMRNSKPLRARNEAARFHHSQKDFQPPER
jgi:hypothetical protein